MSSLSAPAPDWVIELGVVAGEACDRLAAAVPASSGWYLRPDPWGRVLVATVNATGMGDREVVTAAAAVLAPLWPGWLADFGVGCSVVTPRVLASAHSSAMVALASGTLSPSAWWLAASVERRVT